MLFRKKYTAEKNIVYGRRMKEQRPKRRKDKYNPYTIHTKNNEFYVTIEDIDQTTQEIM